MINSKNDLRILRKDTSHLPNAVIRPNTYSTSNTSESRTVNKKRMAKNAPLTREPYLKER